MSFAHLHTHTEHSALDGLARIKSLPQVAADLGQTAMAITDHGSLTGWWKFNKACKAAGIKPILGIEAYMAVTGSTRLEPAEVEVESNDDDGMGDADDENTNGRTKKKRYEHLTILARTVTGGTNLLRMYNESTKPESYFYKPLMDYDLLAEYGEGLIVLTGCLAGPVAGPLSRSDMHEARQNVRALIDAVGAENVYLEVMDHGIAAEQKIFDGILRLSEEFGLKLVATNDCHYTHSHDALGHEAFLAVGTKSQLDDPSRFHFNGSGYHVKSEEEMLSVRNEDWWAEAVANSQLVADRVADSVLPEPKMRLPKFPLPEGYESSEDLMKDLIRQGLDREYGDSDFRHSDAVQNRLNTEWGVVQPMGMIDYYLIVWDAINWCKSDLPIQYDRDDLPRKKPILIGLGRGSAAGSFFAYLLQITGVDPIKHELLFERFLEPGRVGMPDVDTDVEDERRWELHAYLSYKYGYDKVARIGSFGSAKSKAALKNAARVLKFSGKTDEDRKASQLIMKAGDELAALLPVSGVQSYSFAKVHAARGAEGRAFFAKIADLDEISANHYPQIQRTWGQPLGSLMLSIAQSMEDVATSPGIHPCGFVISDEPLNGLVPLRQASYAAGADPRDTRVITWDGADCEEFGLLKLDWLGLSSLSVAARGVSNVIKSIEKGTDKVPTTLSKRIRAAIEAGDVMDLLRSVPAPWEEGEDVVQAWKLLSAGRTEGVFQMSEKGMQDVSRKVGVDSLNDASVVVALYRPGPLSAGVPDTYADRKHGREPVSYDKYTTDPEEQKWIATVLDETYGLIIYQEQMMRLGSVLAGFDAKQRSLLRKAVGKKDKEKMAQVHQLLLDNCGQEFHDESGKLISPVFSTETVERIYDDIKGAAEYSFNKSHSVAYGYLAYVTAYLKANYPPEFAAGALAVLAGKPDKRLRTIMSLRREGIEVVSPDVNASGAESSAVGEKVSLGLAEIKDVGKAGVGVVAEREANGPFKDLRDLMARVKVEGKGGKMTPIQTNHVTALIAAGACDSLIATEVDGRTIYPRLGAVMALRAWHAGHEVNLQDLPYEWHAVESAARQREKLGLTLGQHPMRDVSVRSLLSSPHDWAEHGYEEDPEGRYSGRNTADPIADLDRVLATNAFSTKTAGVLTAWKERPYKGGIMAKFTIESPNESLSGVTWNDSIEAMRYSGYTPAIGDPMVVSGRLKETVTVINEGEEDEEKVVIKEISASRMGPLSPLGFPSTMSFDPVALESTSSFVTGYREIYESFEKAPEPDPVPPTVPPVGPGTPSVAGQGQSPAPALTPTADPAPASRPVVEKTPATVTHIDEYRTRPVVTTIGKHSVWMGMSHTKPIPGHKEMYADLKRTARLSALDIPGERAEQELAAGRPVMYRVGPLQRPLVVFFADHAAAAARFAEIAAEQEWVAEDGYYRLPDAPDVAVQAPHEELSAAY